MPGNTPDSSARVVWLANLRKGITTHFHNVPYVAKSLDIIDNGRALVETENGGKIGRFDPRIGSLPLQGFDQSGLLPADVCSRPTMNNQVTGVVSA